MGANAEHKIQPPTDHSEQVRWIGREPAPHEPFVTPTGPLTSDSEGGSRTGGKWIAAAVVAAILAVVAWLLWRGSAEDPALVTLSSQHTLPLVSVMSPGVTAVTSNVTFTGAIAARYDMPIGIDGDAGRIVGIYVEAGDHVKRGPAAGEARRLGAVPQVNRLAASLEQARAQAALSAAEYRRAQAVAPAGALSAEDIEKRRATVVTDEAKVKVAAAQLAEAQARFEPHACRRARRRHRPDAQRRSRPDRQPRRRRPVPPGQRRRSRDARPDRRAGPALFSKSASRRRSTSPGSSRPFEGRVRLLGAVIDPQHAPG